MSYMSRRDAFKLVLGGTAAGAVGCTVPPSRSQARAAPAFTYGSEGRRLWVARPGRRRVTRSSWLGRDPFTGLGRIRRSTLPNSLEDSTRCSKRRAVHGWGRSVTATFNTTGTGGTCANAITFSGNTGSFNTTGAGCYRTGATVNGWGCSNFATSMVER
jgi:hypothetical protein